jgi:hypothetical protein
MFIIIIWKTLTIRPRNTRHRLYFFIETQKENGLAYSGPTLLIVKWSTAVVVLTVLAQGFYNSSWKRKQRDDVDDI